MNNGTEIVLALNTPQQREPNTGMNGEEARRFLNELLGGPDQTAGTRPSPTINAVAIQASAGSPTIEMARTPAPIRRLKEDGIIGVT